MRWPPFDGVWGRLIGRVGCSFLSLLALGSAPEPLSAQSRDWEGTPQEAFRNSQIVQTYQCQTCHTIAGGGGTVGPILNQVGNRRTEEWLRDWLEDAQAVKPGTKMPKFPFTPEQYEQAIGYLTAMRRELATAEILASNDHTPVETGEALFKDFDCLACHRIGGEGRFIGPDLTWVGLRKERSWERVWLRDPPAWKPGTFMPNFQLSPEAIEALTAYLGQLRGQANEAGQAWEFRTAFFIGGEPPKLGEQVFKRFACWACHGEKGVGGERNPNAAPDELVPAIREVTLNHGEEELREQLSQRSRPAKLDPQGPEPPFACPAYATEMSEVEFQNLYAYLETLVPEGLRWRFR